MQWLGDVAKLYGGIQLLISGNRTSAEQLRLYNFQSKRPAAYPGCSQHQYGFAADANWLPFTTVTSKGKALVYGQEETDRFMNSAARHAGLTLVAGDQGHVQMYPGLQFREYVVRLGLCPAVPPPPLWNISRVQSENEAYRDCLLAASRSNRLLGADSPGFRCSLPCGPLFRIPC